MDLPLCFVNGSIIKAFLLTNFITQTLKTEDIGRLVIYAPVISSTMHVINDFTLAHGTAVIARQQSDGKGRGGNQVRHYYFVELL